MDVEKVSYQYLRDKTNAFRPVKWCKKCKRNVSKYHKHWGMSQITAYPQIKSSDERNE